jgi:transcriptional regulator with GAF, ATPase, and Fis domain
MLQQLFDRLQATEAAHAGGRRAEVTLNLTVARSLVGSLGQELADAQAEAERYKVLLDRTLQVTTAEGLQPVARAALDGVMAVVGARRGFVGITEPGGWSILVARNLDQAHIREPEGKVSTSIIEQALRTGEPVVSHDAMGELSAASVHQLSLRSVACMPLRSGACTLGFIYLDDPLTRGLFDEAALAAVRGWLPLVAGCVQRAEPAPRRGLPGVITRSSRLLDELDELARVARFDAPVLLTGETGTGKSWIARQVHAASPRAARPFVHINCGAIPEALIEGELFGVEAGAFTGARQRRPGKFEAADGGTLFLDELDSMPPSCQVKLLVALQERAVTRLGGNAEIPVDVRVISAMGAEPMEAIADGRLREDLYYRLALFVSRLPPLRERPEDVPLLARHILERARARYDLPALRLSPAAEAALARHDWPGNVRELENALDRAALLSRDGLIASFSPAVAAARPPAPQTPSADLQQVLDRAAELVVAAMVERDAPRELGRIAVLRGAVLEALVRRLGSREAAFEFLDMGAQVKAGNHHRTWRREVGRLRALLADVGGRA